MPARKDELTVSQSVVLTRELRKKLIAETEKQKNKTLSSLIQKILGEYFERKEKNNREE